MRRLLCFPAMRALSGLGVLMVLGAGGLAITPYVMAQATLPSVVATTRRSTPPVAGSLHLAQRQLEELRSRSARRYSPADLIKLAADSSPELKYAAATAAMREAISLRQVSVARQARDLVVKSFDIQPASIDHAMVKALAEAQLPGPAAVLAMRSIEASLSSGDVQRAQEFSAMLTTLMAAIPEDLKARAKDCLADFRTASGLQTRASSQPASSAGLFECLYLGQWKDNLQRIANGDGDLAECARRDLDSTDARSRFAAAEAWWLSGQAKSIDGWRVASRATQIYDEILPQLSGVDRELVLSRKTDHMRAYVLRNAYRPGIEREVSHNGTTTHESCTLLELPKDSENLPTSGSRVVYRGLLLAQEAGRHEFTFAGGSGMRVAIDDNELINSPTAYRKRSGEKVELDLAAGLHSFEIEVWSNSSKPRLAVKWSTPARPQAQAIAATELFSDPLTDNTK